MLYLVLNWITMSDVFILFDCLTVALDYDKDELVLIMKLKVNVL